MSFPATRRPPADRGAGPDRGRGGAAAPTRRHAVAWAAVGLGVLAVAVAWILETRMRPSYDAFGWLDWGRQALHWDLNLDGAPSWKPLTFLFTLPYALAGPNPQVWLWMITATTAAAAAGVRRPGRLQLTAPRPAGHGRRGSRRCSQASASLGLAGLAHQVLIANSDRWSSRSASRRSARIPPSTPLALILLVLAGARTPRARGRSSSLYAGIPRRAGARARARRGCERASLAGSPGSSSRRLTSHSWFSAGDHALGSEHVITGSKLIGVIDRLRSPYALPAQLAVLAALALAVLRRSRAWLELLAAAALWVVVEIVLAYRGWSAVSRYLLEPGAILVAVAGGRRRRLGPRRPPDGGALDPSPARNPPADSGRRVAAVVALVVAFVPAARQRVQAVEAQLPIAHKAARELTRLESVIARLGGASRIKACGQPVTLLGYQSEVAWAVGLSVGNVGFQPGASIRSGRPIVLLKPHDDGWQIRPYNTSGPCRLLRTDSAMD